MVRFRLAPQLRLRLICPDQIPVGRSFALQLIWNMFLHCLVDDDFGRTNLASARRGAASFEMSGGLTPLRCVLHDMTRWDTPHKQTHGLGDWRRPASSVPTLGRYRGRPASVARRTTSENG
jgi:hypothetical protein